MYVPPDPGYINPKDDWGLAVKRRLLRKGDRIRLKTRTLCGWKGLGSVMQDQHTTEETVWFRKDGYGSAGKCCACSHEVSLLRNQKKTGDD